MGMSVVRPRWLEHLEFEPLLQKCTGDRIAPLESPGGGRDIGYEWQVQGLEFWLSRHGFEPAAQDGADG